MVRVYRCTVYQGDKASSHGFADMYHLPGWLSDRDVSRARARERFRDDDPPETYRPFVELRWIGEDLHVEAGYRTRHQHDDRSQIGSQDQQRERARKLDEWRSERMPYFLDVLAQAFEDEVLLPETLPLRGDWRSGDFGAFRMLPARNEHDDDLRALAELPRQYLRKPIMRALEDVINHGHSKFADGVELHVEYEGRRKA